MDNQDNYKNLISRYLNGELSEKDSQNLREWINESSENKELFFNVKDTWDASLKKDLKDSEQLVRFYRNQAMRQKKVFLTPFRIAIAIAAVLVMGLLIGNLVPFFSGSNQSMETYTVPKGSRSQLVLTDGTKVNLNSDSRLVVDKDFSSNNRMVRLYGEAYFEVKADRNNPFVVQSNKFDIKVTGTKFNVCAYDDIKEIGATLAEGKIELTANNKTFKLVPGNKIIFDQSTMKYKLEDVDTSADMAWINGDVIFKNIPFPDLIKRLERKYEVEISYSSDEIETITYSGKFTNKETLEQLLEAIRLTSSVSYEKLNNREYKIIGKPMY